MTPSFPVPLPSDPRLPLGTWVQSQHFDDDPLILRDDPRYFKQQGIIIGYEFNHPAWSLQNHILTHAINNQASQGWDYRVLIFRQWDDASNIWTEGNCQVDSYFESDVTPINPVQSHIELTESAISLMFWGETLRLLHSNRAQVRIQTHPYSLDILATDRPTADSLLTLTQDIGQIVQTYHLPSAIIIRTSAETLYEFQATAPTLTLGQQRLPVTMPAPVDDIAKRAQRHRALMQATAHNTVGVTLHDTDPATGYQYLDAISPMPQRQNRPTAELIGQPVTIVDPRIGEPRLHAIQRALKHGQSETYHYTYDDDYHWEFDVTVAPLHGGTEILTIVHDAAPWQRGHWANKVLTQKR